MLDEAVIQVHYEQGTKAPLRRKRYLSEAVNYAFWNASFIASIPFNEDGTTVTTYSYIPRPATPTILPCPGHSIDEQLFFLVVLKAPEIINSFMPSVP